MHAECTVEVLLQKNGLTELRRRPYANAFMLSATTANPTINATVTVIQTRGAKQYRIGAAMASTSGSGDRCCRPSSAAQG